MGLYTDISNDPNLRSKDAALQNRQNGVQYQSQWGVLGVGLVGQLPQGLTNIFGSQTAKNSEQTETAENDPNLEQKEAYENERDDLLAKIGAKNVGELESIYQQTVAAENEKITNQQGVINKISKDIGNIAEELKGLYQQKTEAETNSKDFDIAAINAKIAELESKKTKLEQDLNNEQLKLAEIQRTALETCNKLKSDIERIGILENKIKEIDEETSVEVKTEKLSDFNTARKAFEKEPTKANAEALVKAYENNKNNKTIENAYKLLEPKIKKALGQA